MQLHTKYLFSCIALSLLLCLAQIIASNILIIGCLGTYLMLLGWACGHNFTLPVLLYFLPWSTLMKLNPTSFSVYTFGLVLSCGISIFRNRMRLKGYAVTSGIVILFLTLFSKLLDGSDLDLSYIAFLMMLVLLPAVKQESQMGTYDFYQLTVIYSLGVILAALCALWFASYSNIAQYIRVDAYNVVLRRSGFYGDSNFYTAQITAALGGCLFLLLRENRRSRVLILLLIFALVYCGAMSGSKSFVLVIACLVLIWLRDLLAMRNSGMLKILMLLVFAGFVCIVATSDLFRELIAVLEVRFSRTTDFNSLTTHRLELWLSYLNELFSDVKVFFVGKGLTNIKINGRGSHNTILQIFYQLGVLGVPFLIYWNYHFLRTGSFGGRKDKARNHGLLVFLGVCLPWLAIDILFFDEFFLLQWYAFMALYQSPQVQSENAPRASKPVRIRLKIR